MDDYLSLSSTNRGGQRLLVEWIADERSDADRVELARLGGRSSERDYFVFVLNQQGQQELSDRAGATGYKYFHWAVVRIDECAGEKCAKSSHRDYRQSNRVSVEQC